MSSWTLVWPFTLSNRLKGYEMWTKYIMTMSALLVLSCYYPRIVSASWKHERSFLDLPWRNIDAQGSIALFPDRPSSGVLWVLCNSDFVVSLNFFTMGAEWSYSILGLKWLGWFTVVETTDVYIKVSSTCMNKESASQRLRNRITIPVAD